MMKSLNLRAPVLCAECHSAYRVLRDSSGRVRVTHPLMPSSGQCSRIGPTIVEHIFKETDHILSKESGIAVLNIIDPICLNCGCQYVREVLKCRLRIKFTHACDPKHTNVMGIITKIEPLAKFTVWL